MSRLLVALAALTVTACSGPPPATPTVTPPATVVQLPAVPQPGRDPHSFARPDEVRVDAVELDLTVDFDAHVLRGSATLALTRTVADAPLVLDTRDLTIERVEARLPDRTDWVTTTHALAGPHPILGQALTIDLPPGADRVRVHYRTSPASTGLQWLAPEQTSDRAGQFLYTQSQAIHARSWVPCQDSPGIRVTVAARIAAPAPYRAVMAAEELAHETGPNGHVLRTFKLDQPIPAYLLALAVGRLESVQIGPRTAVWAEPGVLPRARAEFADLEAMLTAAEAAVGPYRWGRYEVLVLPAAFPFGGMENPRVTFVTPTILAGDRSLVSLIAHELAHSWSGNLVTNATWRDFWLNEGFTVYVERRILEAIYGSERAEVEAVLGREHLEIELADMADRPGDQILHLDLAGRDPDDAVTDVAYEKGALFLRRLEQAYGRDAFDPFVRAWFDRHAFTGQTTEAFRAFLGAELKAPLLPGQTPRHRSLARSARFTGRRAASAGSRAHAGRRRRAGIRRRPQGRRARLLASAVDPLPPRLAADRRPASGRGAPRGARRRLPLHRHGQRRAPVRVADPRRSPRPSPRRRADPRVSHRRRPPQVRPADLRRPAGDPRGRRAGP
ncbi:M1 family aminopeptidase/hydrolase [Nannocystis pusilla]|uniref:Aminopeptidase N n=1 Tax=Nannocystis pusilla TaxID=889268 RepID=A0A9X3EL72_9BACT|nr:M1 family aminopeptidase/hydrolase [Nannocystis pusilla]MCY1006109.1 M1 family aminopeptidase/hydrolase [Nannocystis pusilla]